MLSRSPWERFRSDRRAVACLLLDLLAEKREMNSFSSWAFSSFFLFWFFIRFCIVCIPDSPSKAKLHRALR